MKETTNPNAAPPITGRVAGLVLGGALALATVAVFNGFPRYDFLQSTLALLGAVTGLGVAASRGVPRRALPAVWALLGLAAYALIAAAIEGTAVGFDVASLIVLLSVSGTAGVLAGREAWPSVIGAAAVGSAACALVIVAEAVGLSVVPEIPFARVSVAAAQGTFDDPGVLAAFAALAVAAGAIGFAGDSPRSGGVAILAGSVCLGAAGFAPLIAVLALAGAVGFAFAQPRLGGGLLVGTALAGIVLLASGARFETVPDVETALVETGVEWPYGEEHAGSFFLNGAVEYAASHQPFGAGAGAYAGEVDAHVDTEHPFATNYFSGRPTSRHAPSAGVELAGDFGFLMPLLLLLLLGLAATRGRAVGAVVAVVGAGVLFVGPGALSGVVVALLGVLIGLSVESESSDERGGVMVVVAALCVAGAVSLVHQVQTLRWGYLAESAVTFLEHPSGSRAQGLEYAEKAAEIQVRFSTEMNLAAAKRGLGDTDHAQLREIYERAVDLRPRSVTARMALADAYVREGARAPDVEERVARVERMFEVAMDLDPNYVRLALLRANAAAASFQFEAAHEALEALSEREIPDPMRMEVLSRLGELYEDAELPAQSKSAYERALPLARDAMQIGRYEQTIRNLEQWIETGVRPQVQRVDPHMGHNHGGGEADDHGEHDHDHGEHDHDEGDHGHDEPGEHDHDEPGEHDHAEHEHGHGEGEHDHGEHDHNESDHGHDDRGAHDHGEHDHGEQDGDHDHEH